MGVHKTDNGAYRYRYAPFLMSTYYVMGCSPLALPLGELSPEVTERASLFRMIKSIGMVICPLRPRCAQPPLPKGEARGARTSLLPGKKLPYDHPASTDAGLFHILLRGMYPPEPTWNQYGSKLEPEVRIGKVSIGKDRIGSAAAKPRHPLDSSFSLTDDEKALKMEKNGGRG